MSKRIVILLLVGVLMLGGLIAGLFAGSIERALMLPANQNRLPLSQASAPTPSPTAAMLLNQPVVTTQAQDTFQRTDQALWGTATDGRSWGGDANTDQAFSILGNTGQIAHSQGAFNAVLGPATPNVEVLLKSSVNRFAGGTTNVGAVVRWNDTKNWYKALIDGAHLAVLKDTGDVAVSLASVPFKAQGGVTYSLRFRAVGAMLFARVWPSTSPEPTRWMITATDTALSTGQVGVRVLLQKDSVVHVGMFMATAASSTM